ncbi:MAG: aminotransferase class I/II-fold pyridoxal phosphate-dependent enzyme [Deltaproteobacteria bacterium]|nr:aminotransferase class I/II-fold pyridoxal phosphate-dependent enzyme [Deltaproteobacteria bacterium]MBI3294389.1 aminotransferase class I/II-fold pyridoxal phosphate-dependent enzyme [Deltaproteobacteria bacterium]
MPADPKSLYSPNSFREWGHELIEQLASHVETSTTGQRPVLNWEPPEKRRDFWAQALKDRSLDFGGLTSEFLKQSISLQSPHYMGHQNAPALPSAAMADLIVSTLNSSSAIYEMGSASTMMEKAVISWMNRHLGFVEGDGVFTSGGSLANLTALLCARQNATGLDVWNKGNTTKLAILSSGFSHYSVRRAAQIMGLGRDSIIEVPVDEAFRIVPSQLENALNSATRSGQKVFACVASSCNTALGTYDPIQSIADFCQRHGLWLHVDGAHGASALLSPYYRSLLDGIERADSVVWDAHKMLMMPALTSAVLFRRESDSSSTFSQSASYLFEKDKNEEWYNISHRTLECTKRAFATRLYFALMLHGEEVLGEYVTRQYNLAQEFAGLIKEHPRFELAVQPQSNIVCFRAMKDGTPLSDSAQREIRNRMIRSGRFYLVQTQLPKGAYLRTTLMNPFTQLLDLTHLLEGLDSIAEGL